MTNQSASMLVSDYPRQPSASCAAVSFLCFLFLVAPVAGARDSRAFLSPVRLNPRSDFVGQEGAEMRSLEPGKQIERDLSSGQSHSYQVQLAADQYLKVAIEQRGIDLVAALFGPDGKKLAEANSAKGRQGTELLAFIADLAGNYRIEVRPAEKDGVSGGYAIKIIALRTPTADDRALEQASRLLAESRALRQKGKYDEALPVAERALEIREKTLGPDEPPVAESLHALAVLYEDTGNYAKAEPLFRRALGIREKALGPDHPDVAESLNGLGVMFILEGDYPKAEPFFQRALAILEKTLGPDHTDVAATLANFGKLFTFEGDYVKAESFFERALAIQERTLGMDDLVVAKTVANLAGLNYYTGNYTRAESLNLRALAVWEKTLGPDHPYVAKTLHNLAAIYDRERDYAKAEPLYLRALAIWEKALGPDHPELTAGINNLADLYVNKGDYAKAEPLYLRALAIREKRLGPNHPEVAWSLSSLGRLHYEERDYAQAAALYQRALAIQEKALGAEHPDVAASLQKLGTLFSAQGDYAKAEPLYQRAVAILEKALGPNHPDVAQALNNLADLYVKKGDYAKAEPLFARALEIGEKSVGPTHPDVAVSLNGLAATYQAKGDVRAAVSFLSRYNDVREWNLNHNLPLGSERQKLDYLKLFAEDTDTALSLHAQLAPHDQQALDLAFTTLLRRKGRALDAMSNQIAALRSRANPQDRLLFGQLFDARARLANFALNGPDKDHAASSTSQLKQLEDEVDKLEAEVSTRSAEFRAQTQAVTLEAVGSLIPNGATLIEFALYHPTDAKSGSQDRARYSAYLLTPQKQPQWVDLDEAATIDRLVEAWRQALRDPQRSDAARLARAVDAKLMQPVRALLGQSEHLLISPDGPLNLIPFAALVDEQNRYLVERYSITYLTSGRDLLRLQVPRDSRSRPVVLADPAFGGPALIASRGGTGTKGTPSSQGEGGRAQVDYSQIFFGPLPGVSDEVRALKELLPEATFLTKEQATKAALERVSGPRLLHIATHGFFLQDAGSVESRTVAEGREGTRLGKWVAHVDNPLLRSGLALAGANQGGDGVLTALEAAGLDLWGTKLVVLSACDTGVGEVKNGDGVYGLRRALILAGAESQMMSLWSVSDRSTRDLMVAYYKELLRGQGRGDALRQVQLRMLRSATHSHPYYWASFIQSGEWANLEGKR